MHGHNAAFTSNPLHYLGTTLADNIAYFRHDPNAGFVVNALNGHKSGVFDFNFAGLNPERRAVFRVAPLPVMGDAPIQAYWTPFLQGTGLPGWVDIPIRNPTHRFVFTAAMQGCHWIITESPTVGVWRVYHNQHADNPNVNRAINQQGHNVVSVLTYDEYGAPGLAAAQASNSFNFLYYRNGLWNYVSQGHIFVPGVGQQLGLRRRVGLGNNGVFIRSVV